MKLATDQGLRIARDCGIAMLLITALSPVSAFAQSDRAKNRGFWVAASAEVTVPADEGIVIMLIRTVAPGAGNTLAQNEQTTQRVTQALDDLHLEGKYRFSANRFNNASVPPVALRAYQPGSAPFSPRLYRPGTPCESSSFEVSRYVLVTFDSSDLADSNFERTLASTIDALLDAGALEPELRTEAAQTRSGGTVFFALKDPQPVQLEAIREATARARAQAEEVAKSSGFRLGGIIDARVNRPLELQLPRVQELTILDEIGLRFYSDSKDAVTIPATFAVQFSTKK
jgi:uncharacterized protein DUF541